MGKSRQIRRAESREQFKQQDQQKKWANAPATHGELQNTHYLATKTSIDLDSLLEVLINKGVITKEEHETARKQILEEREAINKVSEEKDWIKKLDMCDEFGLDDFKKFLISVLQKFPQMVTKEVMNTLMEKHGFELPPPEPKPEAKHDFELKEEPAPESE